MSATDSPLCPKCGAALPPDAPRGLCPRCLMAMNFATETAITGEGGEPRREPLSPADLAPYFPQLEIFECLGRGGMGVVYRARQKSLNRMVALKLLAPERVAVPEFAQRFAREAEALARLSHPHIVTVHDFGETGGLFYLLMEFVDGVNLRQAMAAGRFTAPQALAIVPPICEALQYAHEQGIVHRDIKPENLLLDKAGRVKIADFGIAKMLGAEAGGVGVAESQPAGTPRYMAPEQMANPSAVDHRADIYSLGVVLYEMLTGELPARRLELPSHKVQVDVRLDEIVVRALREHPELRYRSIADFQTDLEKVTAHPEPAPSLEATAPRAPRWRRMSAGLAVLLLMAALAWWSRTGFDMRPQYVATVTMEIRPDDYQPPTGLRGVGVQLSTDERFLATQFQVMCKAEILNQVIEKLHLTETLAPGQKQLGARWTPEYLAGRLNFRLIRNTSLFELEVTDNDPRRAADIANAVATVYKEARLADLQSALDRGFKQYEEVVAKQRQQVAEITVEAARIRERDGVVDDSPEMPTAPLREANPGRSLGAYIEAKQRALQARRFLEAAELKSSEVRMQTMIDFDPVKIWELASPPSVPRRRFRWPW